MPQRYTKKVRVRWRPRLHCAASQLERHVRLICPRCRPLSHRLAFPLRPPRLQDASTALRHSESGMIDSVLVTTGNDGQKFVKMRVSNVVFLSSACHCSALCVPHRAACAPPAFASPPSPAVRLHCLTTTVVPLTAVPPAAFPSNHRRCGRCASPKWETSLRRGTGRRVPSASRTRRHGGGAGGAARLAPVVQALLALLAWACCQPFARRRQSSPMPTHPHADPTPPHTSAGGHALLGRGHLPRPHHQPARHPLPHDHRPHGGGADEQGGGVLLPRAHRRSVPAGCRQLRKRRQGGSSPKQRGPGQAGCHLPTPACARPLPPPARRWRRAWARRAMPRPSPLSRWTTSRRRCTGAAAGAQPCGARRGAHNTVYKAWHCSLQRSLSIARRQASPSAGPARVQHCSLPVLPAAAPVLLHCCCTGTAPSELPRLFMPPAGSHHAGAATRAAAGKSCTMATPGGSCRQAKGGGGGGGGGGGRGAERWLGCRTRHCSALAAGDCSHASAAAHRHHLPLLHCVAPVTPSPACVCRITLPVSSAYQHCLV